MGQVPEARRLLLSWVLLGKTAFDVVLWAIAGLAAGAATAGLFGLVFGMLNALVRLEPVWILACGAYFSLCGAATGGLLGGFARLIDPAGVAEVSRDLRRSDRAGHRSTEKGNPA